MPSWNTDHRCGDRAAGHRVRPAGLAPLLLLVLCGAVGATESAVASETPLARAIHAAKRATIGILQPDAEERARFGGQRFTIRGSGVHLGDGRIVTARHAVERQDGGETVIPDEIHVLTGDFHELSARLIGFTEFLDLALYAVAADQRAALSGAAPLAEREPEPGAPVFTVGYPLGWGPTIVFGRTGNPETYLPTLPSRLVQLDLAACSGNSGGGLFNEQGELVGIVHAIIQTEGVTEERRCSRMAFAVPGRSLRRVLGELLAGRTPTFPRLGLGLTAVKVGTRWRVAVSGASGPARDAGLKSGDLLLSIDDQAIWSAAQLKNYLLEHTVPGQRVRITVERDQESLVLDVILGRS